MEKELDNKEEQEVKDQAEATSEKEVEATENKETTEENTEEVVAEETSDDNALGEMKEKYLRLYSEFENFRRRTSKEKLDLISTANEKLIVDLLPIVDDFDRAMAAFEKADDVEAVKEGVVLIKDKFYKTLEAKGLKPIDAKGEVFDAELHEGITQMPAPEEDLKGKVLEEVEKGYRLGEKVIRYSKVVIGA